MFRLNEKGKAGSVYCCKQNQLYPFHSDELLIEMALFIWFVLRHALFHIMLLSYRHFTIAPFVIY